MPCLYRESVMCLFAEQLYRTVLIGGALMQCNTVDMCRMLREWQANLLQQEALALWGALWGFLWGFMAWLRPAQPQTPRRAALSRSTTELIMSGLVPRQLLLSI